MGPLGHGSAMAQVPHLCMCECYDERFRRCELFILRGKKAIQEQGLRIYALEHENLMMKRKLEQVQKVVEVLTANKRMDPADGMVVKDA